jgi:squalene-hopene/tetraprenyl-beta-curcumene cyclase
MSIGILVSTQNGDGGWPYVRGGSWTEPTVYAVLALLAADEQEPARRGLRWIRAAQRPDGGWPPRPGVDASGWVTALAALLPPEHLDPRAHARAIAWLLRTTGHESTPSYRLREWLLGNTPPADQRFPGWPWIPGAAAWVSPTAIALMALDKQQRRAPSPEIARRLDEGRRFLLLHVCKDGGWNHGSTRPLGYESRPYPETTGMALAALRGVRSPAIELSIAAACRFLDEPRSADAINWLQLGLLAHGRLPSGYCPPPGLACRTLSETSLGILVGEAEKGRNFFLA